MKSYDFSEAEGQRSRAFSQLSRSGKVERPDEIHTPDSPEAMVINQPPAASMSLFAALAEGSGDDDDFEVDRASESA